MNICIKYRVWKNTKKMLLDINRKIWFGDVLSQRQISYLFSDITPQTVGINCYFKADEIEKNVLSKKDCKFRRETNYFK